MTRKRKRVSAIEILEGRRTGTRAGRTAGVRTSRTARLTKKGKAVHSGSGFGASFDVDEPYTVTVDARLTLRDIAEAMEDRIVDGLENGTDPSTGRSYPKSARVSDRIRDLMVRTLRRTYTDSTARWGGGYKRLHPIRATVKWYFADKEAARINKGQYMRKGKDKVRRLVVNGAVGDDIQRGLERHAKRVVDGDIIEPDTKARAKGKR